MWLSWQEPIKEGYHLVEFGDGDQRFKWLYGQEPIKVSCQPAKFDGNRHCGDGDVMILVCHVISQDYVIKELFDVIGVIPSR